LDQEQLQQQVAAAVAAAKDVAEGKQEAAAALNPPGLFQVVVGLAALATVKLGADNLSTAVSGALH
jgi:hypothetical protein